MMILGDVYNLICQDLKQNEFAIDTLMLMKVNMEDVKLDFYVYKKNDDILEFMDYNACLTVLDYRVELLRFEPKCNVYIHIDTMPFIPPKDDPTMPFS